MKTYNVPGSAGTLWTVCTISGTTISDVNSMSYMSVSSSITKTRANANLESDAAVILEQQTSK
jgi:hypothetical protein